MFGIDGPEFIVILIVLIVVVGPKDLPKMLKAIGKATARMRSTANEFRRQFDEAMREAELDDLQKTLTDVKDLDPRKKLTEIFDPIRDVAKDVKASIDGHQDAETSSTDDQTSEKSDNKSSNEADSAAADKSKPQSLTSNRETVSSVRIVDDEKFQSATVPTASAGGDSMATEEHPATQTSPEVKEAKPTAGKSDKGNITEKQSTTSKTKTAAKRKVSATSKPSSSKKATISGAIKASAQEQKTVKKVVSGGKKTTTADV